MTSYPTAFDVFVDYARTKYPTITNIHKPPANSYSITPVFYQAPYASDDGINEYPSVIRWTVDGVTYSFAPVPVIRTVQHTYFFGLFKGRRYQILDNSTAYKQVLHVMALTVKGLSEKEINERLGWYIDRFGEYHKVVGDARQ